MAKLKSPNKELSRKGCLLLPFQVILALKMVFERLMNIFLTFSLRQTFYRIAALNGSEIENINTLTTLNETYKIARRLNNASQICQGEPSLLKILETENKNNEKFNSTENLSNCEKEDISLHLKFHCCLKV